MSRTLGLLGVLVLLGLGWGAAHPLAKIAMSTGHGPVGLLFWQVLIGAVALGVLVVARGGWPRLSALRLKFWAILAVIGTLIPNTASYMAVDVLPSGIVSILLAMVPVFGYPIALVLGLERFVFLRFLGLVFGLVGVALIMGPEASLPSRALLVFVPLALVGPFFYALEAGIVGRWGIGGMDPIEALFGASVVCTIAALPMALAAGRWINPLAGFGIPEAALVVMSLLHAAAYPTYVWLVGRAGAVFALQCTYLVTAFGVVWAMLLLGESYAWTVWLAMAVMFAGVALIQPREHSAVAQAEAPGAH